MTLTELGDYIDRKQPKPFVHLYLNCLIEEYQLSVPTDLKIDDLNKKWDVILSKYRNTFSDEFCNGVSDYWLSLLKQCDVSSNQLELDLFNAAGLTIEEKKDEDKEFKKKKKTTLFDIPKKIPNQSDPLTTPQISEQYHQREMAENVSFPEIDKLDEAYKKAFKSNDVIMWLVSHLTFVRYGQTKSVPKSSVPANIREQWELVIATEFDTIADDEFLTGITNEWFYLVNQKGIPTDDNHLEEILMTFLAKQQSQEGKQSSKKGEKKGSFFKRLFGN